MNINWERKTTKFQKSFLFPQLISGDPRLQEGTQAWQSISNSGSPDGLVIPVGNFADEQTKTDVSFLSNTNSFTTLLRRDDSESFRTRWDALEFRFIDDPRGAIREADRLVGEIVEKITRIFANQAPALEIQLSQGNDLSTDDLRRTLQHYRSFFDQLVV